MISKDYSHNRVKEARIVDDLYRLWIRTLPCAVRGCNRLDVDAHHPINSRFDSRKRFGKAHDTECQPLCRTHHAELHDKIATAWSDGFRERASMWLSETEGKIRDIEDSVLRIEDWIREDEERLR